MVIVQVYGAEVVTVLREEANASRDNGDNAAQGAKKPTLLAGAGAFVRPWQFGQPRPQLVKAKGREGEGQRAQVSPDHIAGKGIRRGISAELPIHPL